MDLYEMQRHRADNQIWNGAANYGFSTDYQAFDENGNASLYLNTAMGLIRRYYDYAILEEIFQELSNGTDGDSYAQLLWLGLERCAWLKAKEERPALTDLRLSYAEECQKQYSDSNPDRMQHLQACWFRRILQENKKETPWETKVLDALEFPVSFTAEQIKLQVEQLLKEQFKRTLFGNLIPADTEHRHKPRYKGMRYQKSWAVRHLGFASDENTIEKGFWQIKASLLSFGHPKPEKVREYIESCFGKSLLPETQRIALEKRLCTGAHENCYFHITKGERSDRISGDEAQMEQKRFQEQQAKNKAYYTKHLVQNRLAIQQLAQCIRNTLLLREDDADCRLRSGRLKNTIAWRAIALKDSQIFAKPQSELPDDLVVDILLDASASQLHRQETLATQAYILAFAMTKCDIPVRVLSYCSVSGCTVLRMYRDYYETNKNEAIFAYTAAGWNRDGLALRAMDWLLEQGDDSHRLLLILSDANPNDDQKMPVESRFRYSREYSGKAALQETAREAAKLRKGNRTVLCLYSGLDCNLENAETIYGKEVIKIHDIHTFAETVGKVIQRKLQAL